MRCASCHNSNSPIPNWGNYDLAYVKRALIYQRVVVLKTMPLGPAGAAMTQDERDLVARWVNDGALQDVPVNGITSPVVPPVAPPVVPDCDSSLNSKLLSAAYDGDFETVQKLVSAKACINARDNRGVTVLLMVAMDGDSTMAGFTDIAKLLLSKGVLGINENYDGASALDWALVKGFPEIARALIDAGADVNSLVDESTNDALKDKKGYSPAMLAVLAVDIDTLKILFQKGAKPDAKAADGKTAKTLAARLDESPKKMEIRILIKKYLDILLAPPPVPVGPAPALTPELLAKGKASYARNCAACHGDKGDGNGQAASALNPKPRDFTTEKYKYGDSPAQVFQTIASGVKDTAMPQFDSFPVEERWGLIYYILSLKKDGAKN